MPEPEFVVVWDADLKRTYPMVKSAAEAQDGLEILDGHSALDDTGNLVAPEFDLPRKPAGKSGEAAPTEKEKSNG